MKKSVMTIATMALAMTMVSCGSSKNVQGGVKGTESMEATKSEEAMDEGYLILSDEQRSIVDKNNGFALNLFHEISGFDSKVVSPMSISYLMGMLANGADGQTREEILKTIGCEGVSVEDLNALYKMMLQKANSLDKQTTVNIANYIALNKQYQLKNTFAGIMKNDYQAGVENLDFASSASVKHINQWCSKQTNGMIPSMISQLDANAVSCIMNAIYFKGAWTDKFDKKNTKLEAFHGYTRDIKKAQMMHRQAKYQYADGAGYSAVRIPYGNRSYEMVVLLPNQGSSIDEMMKKVDVKSLAELRDKMDECMVDLKLPRFTTELSLPLNGIISKLGAPSMFGGNANFSNFATGSLSISKMLQKAKIEVSEEGTKAAAVTAAIMTMSLQHPDEPRRVDFHADRPFVYMITEANTGAILFMGQFTGSEL